MVEPLIIEIRATLVFYLPTGYFHAKIICNFYKRINLYLLILLIYFKPLVNHIRKDKKSFDNVTGHFF